MQKLPVDVSSFELMRKGNYLYIDKTRIIHHLITARRLYFLSRPRRFGKSLLISTLKELFSGNKKLFKDLWIEKHSNYTWPKHPVLHFDFSELSYSSIEKFEVSMARSLERIGKSFGLDVSNEPLINAQLQTLIEELAKKNRVVILVDEYDAPLLNNLNNLATATEVQKEMKLFFNMIKSMDGKGHIHAIFITGVTKFAKTSLFSGFNNLNDMTLEPEAATLLGYTKDELLEYFNEHAQLFLAKNNTKITSQDTFNTIQTYYNGYRFSRDTKTPCSILIQY